MRTLYLNFEVVRTFVLAFGHVNGNELKLDIFLKETSKNSRDSRGQRWAVNLNWGGHWRMLRSTLVLYSISGWVGGQ